MARRPDRRAPLERRASPPAYSRAWLVLVVPVIAILSSCSLFHNPASPQLVTDLPSIADAYTEPVWHPSGRVLIFNHTPLARRFRDPGSGQYVYVWAESLLGLWTVNADGTGQRRLLTFPAWTPDWDSSGATLAYMRGGHIWTIAGTDTGVVQTGSTQITFGGQGEFSPSWRPDGAAIAYCVNSMPGMGVYVVPRAGGTSRTIGDVGWKDPDWSPKGDSLVFRGTWSSNTGIGVADSSGWGSHMIWGYPEAAVSYPRWSPDGRTIAFTGRSSNLGLYELWVMGADGSNAHAVTTGGVQAFFSWSPDGKEIAYVRSTPHDTSLVNGTIWTINPVTGAKRQVTFNTPSN